MADSYVNEIIKLKNKGYTPEEIASKLQIDEEEVKDVIKKKEMMSKLLAARNSKKKATKPKSTTTTLPESKPSKSAPSKVKKENIIKDKKTAETKEKDKIKDTSLVRVPTNEDNPLSEIPVEIVKINRPKQEKKKQPKKQQRNYTQEILNLHNQGYSFSEISKQLEIEFDEVERVIKQNQKATSIFNNQKATQTVKIDSSLSFEDMKNEAQNEMKNKSPRCTYRLMLFQYVKKTDNLSLTYADILLLSKIIMSSKTMYTLENVNLVKDFLVKRGNFKDASNLISFCKSNYIDKYGLEPLILIEKEISSKTRIGLALGLYKKGYRLDEIKIKARLTDNEYEKVVNILSKKAKDVPLDLCVHYSSYSSKELNEAILRLKDNEIEFIYANYDRNLKLKEGLNLTKLEIEFLNKSLKKLDYLLKNPDVKTKVVNKISLNLYQYFSEYEKDKVDAAISRLGDKYKEFIKENFDEELNFIGKIEENRKTLERLKARIKYQLTNSKGNKRISAFNNLYSYFSEYTKEEVDKAIDNLSKNDIDFIYTYYSSDLVKLDIEIPDSDKKKFYNIIARIKKNLKYPDRNTHLYFNTAIVDLYEYAYPKTKEEVDAFIDNLDSLVREILYKIYDTNLKKKDNVILTDDEKNIFYTQICNKIKRKSNRKNVKVKELGKAFDGKSVEDVRRYIEFLSPANIKFIINHYDSDLNQEVTLNQKEKNYVYRIISNLKGIIENEENDDVYKSNLDNLYAYAKPLKKYNVTEIINNFDDLTKDILYKIYDKELNRKNDVVLSPDEIKILYTNILRPLSTQNVSRKIIADNLNELFKDSSIEDIKEAIENLSENYKDYIINHYDENLILVKEINNDEGAYFYHIYKRLDDWLENKKEITKIESSNNLYEYASFKTKEEVDELINNFDKSIKDILYKAFDENLNKKDDVILLSDEKQMLYDSILKSFTDVKVIRRVLVLDDLNKLFPDFEREELINAIDKLGNKSKQFIIDYYDENLLLKKEMSFNEKNYFSSIYSRLKTLLKNPDDTKKCIKVFDLYEYAYPKTKEEVDEIINSFDASLKEILYKAFDKNLKRRENVILTVAEHKILHEKILKKLKRDQKKRKRKDLCKFFSEYTKEEILLAIEQLCDSQKEFINNNFDENLKQKENIVLSKEESRTFYNITRRLRQLLKNQKSEIGKKVGNLILYFNEYTKEEILTAIDKLNDDYKAFINEKFDEDLKLKEGVILTKEEKAILNRILCSIKKYIGTTKVRRIEKSRKNLYEYFDEYTKEEVDSVILDLNEKYRNLLQEKYDENLVLKEGAKFDQVESRLLTNMLRTMKNRLEKLKNPGNVKSRRNLYKYFSEYTKEELDAVILKLNDNQRKFLQEKYDENLILKQELNQNERSYLTSIIKRIEKLLKKAEVKKRKSYNDLNEYFDYADNLSEIILELNDDYRRIINTYFDENLKRNNQMFEDGDRRKFENLLLYIERRLNGNNKKIKINDLTDLKKYFLEHTKEELFEAIKFLTKSNQEFIKKYYDEELELKEGIVLNTDEKSIVYNHIVNGLKRLFKNYEETGNYKKYNKNLYEYAKERSDKTKEEVDEIINSLTFSEKQAFCKAYDKDLNKQENVHLTNVEKKIVNNIVYNKIAYGTSTKTKKKIENLCNYFIGRSKDEINDAINMLDSTQKEFVSKKFNENFELIEELSKKEKTYLRIHIIRPLKRILSNENGDETPEDITSNVLYKPVNDEATINTEELRQEDSDGNNKIIEIFNRPEFIEQTKKKSPTDFVIMALKLKHHSTESIAEFLGMDILDVNRIIQINLSQYKKDLLKLIDQAINIEISPSAQIVYKSDNN